MRFPHLRTRTPIQTKTQHPSPLPIMHLFIPSATFRRIVAIRRRLPMQIQIRGHPNGHPQHQPRRILFVPFHCAAAV